MTRIMLQLRSARERIYTDLFFALFAKNFVPFAVKKNNRKDRKENVRKVREGVISLIIFCLVLCVNYSFSQNNTIDSLNTLLKTATHDTTRLRILNDFIESENDDKIWQPYNEQMKLLAEKLTRSNNKKIKAKGKNGLASALNNIGFIYDNQGQVKEALDYFGRSLSIREEVGDKQGIANSLNNIGYIYTNLGQIKEGLKCYVRNLKKFEDIGDKQGMATTLNNIAYIYKYQGLVSEALDFYTRSLKIYENFGNKQGFANSLINIGNIYKQKGMIKEAIENFKSSLKLQEENGDKQGMGESLNNLGHMFQQQELLKEAFSYFNQSLKIRKEISDKSGISHSLNNIAAIYLKQGNYSLAFTYSDSSLKLAKELGYPQNILSAEFLLAKIDSARGKPAGAFEHYKLYIVYRDSIKNKENEKAAIRQQTKYEFEKALLVKEQEEKEKKRILTATIERRDRIQYSVTLIVIVVLLSFVMLIGKIKVNLKVAEGLIFFVFLILFEFILVLADPYIENFTGGAPGYKLLFNAIIAALIFPLHAFFEKKLKRRLMKQNTIEHG